jgi:hypothetical protein
MFLATARGFSAEAMTDAHATNRPSRSKIDVPLSAQPGPN